MSIPPRGIWAYTYRLTPPQSAERLRKVKKLLALEHREATARDGTWEGRMVVDDRVANILVLSDSPDLDRDVNRRLEAELRAIDSGFAVTIPFEFHGSGHPYAGHADDDDADDSVVGGPATPDPSDAPIAPPLALDVAPPGAVAVESPAAVDARVDARASARTPRVPRKK